MLIATHDGSFHADETLACAILTYLYENSNIIRSRDLDVLEKADIIIDVSGKNDHKHFDHHSNDFKDCRSNGIRFATAGIMWYKFGLEFLKKLNSSLNLMIDDEQVFQNAFYKIDREIMYMVDLNDNGQLNDYLNEQIEITTANEQKIVDTLNEFYQYDPSIPYIVATQNLSNVSAEEQNKAFLATVKLLKQILIGACQHALLSENGIKKVLACYNGGKLLVMHEHLPWSNAVFANFELFKDCILAVYPDRKRGFRIQSLPFSKAERFKNKCKAPLAWRGLDDDQLDKATGLNGTIFVHRAGFTGGAKDFDIAMEMAKMWLEQGEYA